MGEYMALEEEKNDWELEKKKDNHFKEEYFKFVYNNFPNAVIFRICNAYIISGNRYIVYDFGVNDDYDEYISKVNERFDLVDFSFPENRRGSMKPYQVEVLKERLKKERLKLTTENIFKEFDELDEDQKEYLFDYYLKTIFRVDHYKGYEEEGK